MANLLVSSSPRRRGTASTQRIMLDVLIALVPALIAGTVIFGLRVLLLTAVCVASCVLFEYLSRKIMKRSNSISDLSAAVTGLLLALNLPANIPLWMAVFGCLTAIVAVKQFFGGLGQNFVNPALAARIILLLCFASAMTSFPAPVIGSADGVTGATPLVSLNGGNTDSMPSLLDMFLGLRGGSCGETCALALIVGGIYLMIRRVIAPTIPVIFVSAVFLFTLLVSGSAEIALYHVLSGGLLLGAIFMATDYVTSPVTTRGKVIYALGCGLITSVIRLYGSLPEGVSYSIILMNIFTPLIDKLTVKKTFGAKKEASK